MCLRSEHVFKNHSHVLISDFFFLKRLTVVFEKKKFGKKNYFPTVFFFLIWSVLLVANNSKSFKKEKVISKHLSLKKLFLWNELPKLHSRRRWELLSTSSCKNEEEHETGLQFCRYIKLGLSKRNLCPSLSKKEKKLFIVKKITNTTTKKGFLFNYS